MGTALSSRVFIPTPSAKPSLFLPTKQVEESDFQEDDVGAYSSLENDFPAFPLWLNGKRI